MRWVREDEDSLFADNRRDSKDEVTPGGMTDRFTIAADRVIPLPDDLSDTEAARQQTIQRQAVERDRLTVQVYGAEQARQMRGTFRIPNPTADAEHARRRAAEARRIIAELDARPVAEAAEWLTHRREKQRIEREALQARQEALTRRNAGPTRTGPDHQRGRPGLSL